MSQVYKAAVAALIAFGAAACHPRLESRWYAQEEIARARGGASFEEAPAVALFRARRILFYYGSDESFTQLQHHEAIEVRNEAGKALATVRIPVWGKGRLEDLRARTIAPDGTVRELAREEMMETRAEGQRDADGYLVRLFRFPEVKVGSVLECSYTVQYPWVVDWRDERIVSDIPVRAYELELKIHDRLRFAIRAYNTRSQFEESKEGEYRTLHLRLSDLAADADEWRGPHWSVYQPWWSLRIFQYTYGTWASEPTDTFTRTIRGWAREIRSGSRLYEGFVAPVPAEACGDARCKVSWALRWVHDHTRGTDFGEFGSARPLKEVVEGVNATGAEQAILLRKLLIDSGVRAELAPTVHVLSRLVDRDFPAADKFNYFLVYVPEQAGLSAALWLDPTCRHCAPGALPGRSWGVEALVFPSDDDGEAVFRRVTGARARANSERRTTEVVVDPAGDAVVTRTEEFAGDDVLYHAAAAGSRKAEEHRAAAARVARQAAATAVVESFEPMTCDERAGVCRRTTRFNIPGYATRDGNRLLIPLSLLSADPPVANDGPRRTDVHLRSTFAFEDEVTLRLPPGYSAPALPGSAQKSSPAVSVAVQFTRGDGWIKAKSSRTMRAGIYRASDWPLLAEVLGTIPAAGAQMIEAVKD